MTRLIGYAIGGVLRMGVGSIDETAASSSIGKNLSKVTMR